jgi:alkaline phosphatase D
MRRLSFLILILLIVATASRGDDKTPISRIAFGSCAHQERDQPIWEPILRTKPELFLFIGDNIYADTEDMDVMRAKYKKLGDKPGYKKLLAACPVLATWDDHDYGRDDAGAEYPKKKESQEAFLDFFGIAKDSPRRKQEGVYHSEVFGPAGKRVQIILLDTRYHRTALKKDLKRPKNIGQYVPVEDENATILGAAQWKWLEQQLKVPAEVRLVCSSIQVVAEDHGFEKWMNIPKERAKLYGLIRDTKASGVIFLSGDRHLAELSMMEGAGYPLFDLTSSGLNQGNKRWRALETNKHRVATMNMGDNYGLVKIDWEKTDPVISLEIHDDEGDVIIRRKVPLSRLQVNTKKGKESTGDLAAEARKHLDKEWTFEMRVLATGGNKG